MSHHRPLAVISCLLVVSPFLMAFTSADDPAEAAEQLSESPSRQHVVSALRPLSPLIGEWKGVGQPRRGSNAGAWLEKADVAWRFESDAAAIVMTFEPGQQFRTAVFSFDSEAETPILTLTPLKGDPVILNAAGLSAEQPAPSDIWTFEAAADQSPQTRCTVRLISEIRMTLLLEQRSSDNATYRRLSEIGLTRAGTRLARGNTGERECIVTGGLGTIKVEYLGKSYYVCCSGCKQAFDADPAGTIEAWQKRLKDEVKPSI